jgi:peptidoglycan/LPS O-acetylase OafA/YrhL
MVCFAAVDSLLPRPVYRLLTNPVLSYIGKISYGLYLLHPIAYNAYYFIAPKFYLPLVRDAFVQDAVAFVAEIGLAFVFASASWYFFEHPLLGLKKKFAGSEICHTHRIQQAV